MVRKLYPMAAVKSDQLTRLDQNLHPLNYRFVPSPLVSEGSTSRAIIDRICRKHLDEGDRGLGRAHQTHCLVEPWPLADPNTSRVTAPAPPGRVCAEPIILWPSFHARSCDRNGQDLRLCTNSTSHCCLSNAADSVQHYLRPR